MNQANQREQMSEDTNDEPGLPLLFEQINQHLETRLAYFSLSATEKVAIISANLVGAFTIFVFAVLVLFFFSMGFAWWLGDFIDNRAAGFALAGLIFLPISFLVYRWIRPFVRAKVIQSILQDETIKNTHKHG
jgi:hypothetical protein